MALKMGGKKAKSNKGARHKAKRLTKKKRMTKARKK